MKWVHYFFNNKKNSGAHQSIAVRLRNILGMIFALLSATFIAALVMVILNSRKENSISESETVINGIVSTINGNMGNYKDISRLVMINDTVTRFMKKEEDVGLIYDSVHAINDILIVCDNVDSFFTFRDDGQYVTTGRGDYIIDYVTMASEKWQNPIDERMGGAVIFMNGNGAVFRKNGKQFITIARTYCDLNTQKKQGILLMNISTEMLDQCIGDITNAQICVVAEDGSYIAGDPELCNNFSMSFLSGEMVHRYNGDGKFNMVSGYKPEGLPFVIMCKVIPSGVSLPVTVITVLFLLAAVFVASIVRLVSYITKNINEPILELTEAMEDTKKAGWLKKIEVNMPDNEIGQLATSYNSMNEYLNDVLDRLIEKEKAVQRVEMRVLQEQIKPHFLYNSLETIGYMACEAGADKVYSALETLGSFYRNFLSKGEREIPLKRELQIIKDYLSIQKLRYGDAVNDEYDIDDEVLEYKIPKLILQPLVENSIYHGVRLKGEPGMIRISAHKENDKLIIKVYDSGVGMSEEQIEKILKGEEQGDKSAEERPLSGFGLSGTIKRIRYYCKDDDAVRIFSEEGEYTEIVLKIGV